MISIEAENTNQDSRQKSNDNIYLLAKKLAEVIGDLDKKRNNIDESIPPLIK